AGHPGLRSARPGRPLLADRHAGSPHRASAFRRLARVGAGHAAHEWRSAVRLDPGRAAADAALAARIRGPFLSPLMGRIAAAAAMLWAAGAIAFAAPDGSIMA